MKRFKGDLRLLDKLVLCSTQCMPTVKTVYEQAHIADKRHLCTAVVMIFTVLSNLVVHHMDHGSF